MNKPSFPKGTFSEKDLQVLKSKSIDEKKLESQFQKYAAGTQFTKLLEPITAQNGLVVLSGPDCEIYSEAFDRICDTESVEKFVPGSIGANKIFTPLANLNNTHDQIDKRMLEKNDYYTEQNLNWFSKFIKNLKNYAFIKDLNRVLISKKQNLDTLLAKGEYKEILKALLDSDGLNYSELPMGLLKIHDYPELGSVTPIEEHIMQEAEYLLHGGGMLKVHFTATNEFYPLFREHLEEIKKKYHQPGIHLNLEVSFQDPHTYSLVVDFEHRPFRDSEDALMFIPGGHGTLLKNIQQLSSDLIFIKTMNDVCHDKYKKNTVYFQKQECI